MLPGSVNSEPEPMFIISSREGAGVGEVADDVAELVVDHRDDRAPRDAGHAPRRAGGRAASAMVWREEPAVHRAAASGSSAVTSPSPSA